MILPNLPLTQPEVAKDLARDYEGGFLPQSLLFCGPAGSSRMTAALDLSFALLGKPEDRDTLRTGNIVYFSHRDFYGPLSSAIALFEKERNSASRLFLIETVRRILFQYHSSVTAVSPPSMDSLFSLASDTDSLLSAYEDERDYSEKEIQTLCSFLRSKCLDPKFLYGGKRSPSSVTIDEIRGVQEWFSSGSEEKIAIFEDIEDALEGARNSLLKVLEEPDEHSHMILISSNPQKIMQTILSRVRKYNFPALPGKTISELLKTKFRVWEDYTTFYSFFFQTGSGEEARKELEEDVALFTNALVSGKRLELEQEERLLNSLEKLSAYPYFKERIGEELLNAMKNGRLSPGRARKCMDVINSWLLSSAVYNMSEKNSLDLMLREAEHVK